MKEKIITSMIQKVAEMATCIDEHVDIGDNEPLRGNRTALAEKDVSKALKRSSEYTYELVGGGKKRRIGQPHAETGHNAMKNEKKSNSDEEVQDSGCGPDVVMISTDPPVFTSRSAGVMNAAPRKNVVKPGQKTERNVVDSDFESDENSISDHGEATGSVGSGKRPKSG